MTKQEEILRLTWKFLDDYDKDNGNPAVDWAFILLHRLADKGVAIKVGKPLPKPILGKNMSARDKEYKEAVWEYSQEAMIEAGYTATEPLIKNG